MGKLEIKYKKLLQALDTFYDAMDVYQLAQENRLSSFHKNEPNSEKVLIGLRNSLIQRFEYTIELLWKHLKDHLEITMSIVLDLKGPKNVVRQACKVGLLSEPDSKLFIMMLDLRNHASHRYKEEVAEMIVDDISDYYKLMDKISKKIRPL